MSTIVPAVLPQSHADFDDKLARLMRIPGITRVQVDVVDGRFVTPASWPYTAPHELEDRVLRGEFLPALDRIAYEIDLMCFDAERAAGIWLDLGASRLTLHAESVPHLGRTLAALRTRYGHGGVSHGLVSFGLALNQGSELALIEPYLDQIQYVQFMGIVRIGRQGQPFSPSVMSRIKQFHAAHPNIAIQVDGGVSRETAKLLLAAGATDLIVGSKIIGAERPAAAFAQFESLGSPFL